MSEGTPRPHTDHDAWAKACAEDLAEERARRQAGAEPGSAAEELRRLADAIADKVAELRPPGAATVAQAVISQVKAGVETVCERHPEVVDHLAAAGAELLAAYRAAVTGQESRWTRRPATGTAAPTDSTDGPASEHIDLD